MNVNPYEAVATRENAGAPTATVNLGQPSSEPRHALPKKSLFCLPPKFILCLLVGLLSSMPALAKKDKEEHAIRAFRHLAQHPKRRPGQKVLPAAPVRVHEELRDQHWIELNIAEDVSYLAAREHVDDLGGGDYVWSGRVQGEPLSRVTVSVRQGVAAGAIMIPRDDGAERYVLEPTPSGDSVLVAADGGSAGDGQPIEPPPLPVGDGSPPVATASNPACVDVMVLYTTATGARWGQAGIEAKINDAIAYSNLGYLNSGVHLSIHLVHTEEIAYTETGYMDTTLNYFVYGEDAITAQVRALRDQYAADLVVLVSEDCDYCGLSYVMTVVTTGFADLAYSVVQSNCLNAGNLTFPHEIAHAMGCQHDRANADYQGAFPYSYGYRHCETGGWRTMMAYSTGCSVPRINYYSTPTLSYLGDPLGVPATDPNNAADNARSLNETVLTVAQFRLAPVPPPDAPTALTATATAYNAVALAWTDNASNETSYKVERSFHSNSAWTEIASLCANSVSFVDTTVGGSTTYYYRVRAANSVGCSEYAASGAVTTPDGPPPAPGNLGATALNNSQIQVTWTDTNTETEFRLERSTDNLNWAEVALLSINTTSYLDLARSGATTYYYRVRALNNSGSSPYSNTCSATTYPDPVPPPTAPSNLAAAAATCSQIDLSWTDNAANEVGFEIERSPNGVNQWIQVGAVSASVTGFSDTGLSASTTYYYRVLAYNTGGDSAYSNIVGATTQPPIVAPSGLVASATSWGQVNLSWIDNATTETWQEIERSTDGNAWAPLDSVAANLRSYLDVGLVPASTYYYRVRARNGAATSAYSPAALVTTPVQAPSSFTASSVGTEDGYVLESGENKNVGSSIKAGTAYVGDSSKNYQYKSIFSFDTSPLPDGASIESATVRLNLAAVSGTSPFQTHGCCLVDLKSGSGFGGATALAAGDFQAAADLLGATTMSSVSTVGQWSQGALPTAALPFVNTAGRTQARVYFQTDDNNDLGTDYVSFYTGTASTTTVRPQLVVQYRSTPVLPAAPTNLATEPASVTQIALTWTDNATNENGFWIERSEDGTTWLVIGTVAANTTAYTDGGLVTGATYSYRVAAYNDAGLSVYAGPASAIPQTPPITVTFSSIGTEDGYVLESGENSNVGGSVSAGKGYVGDSNRNYQYRTIFSFDTSSLPEGARIASAKLRLLRTGVSGTSPFDTHGACKVDIKSGTGFGGSAALATGDFQAAADGTAVGFLGNAASNGTWSEAGLASSAFCYVNTTGRTQFRVYFQLDDNNDGGNDYLIYATGADSNTANRPKLIIKYYQP